MAESEMPAATANTTPEQTSRPRAWLFLGTLVAGYIGIYLCRKNFSVAIGPIREAFHLDKEHIGIIASYSTLAYMIGKFLFGPFIDRFGGRVAFLLSLFAVAIFGALGGMVSSVPMLAFVYSLNRLAGSAGWGGMVKQVPNWFEGKSMSFAMGVLSLGFVFGGVCATILAGFIADWSGKNWRWVMSGPSLALGAILIVCWAILPREPARQQQKDGPGPRDSGTPESFTARFAQLAAVRRFWIVGSLSFTLTLLRETFNTWTVDFFKTTYGDAISTKIAAFVSTPFDALGAVGIVLLGWVFGRLGKGARSWLLFAILSSLAALIFVLPSIAAHSVWLATIGIGGIGFLAYGPYSLLAGVLAVEIKGKEYVATAAGIFDGVGYLAGILSGQQFGRILDLGGYRLGFTCLAGLAAVSAVLCLFLYGWAPETKRVGHTSEPETKTEGVSV